MLNAAQSGATFRVKDPVDFTIHCAKDLLDVQDLKNVFVHATEDKDLVEYSKALKEV